VVRLIKNWRILASEALGLNRRDQDLLSFYNPRHLFQLVNHKRKTKEILRKFGLPVPLTLRVYQLQHDIADFAAHVQDLSEFVIKPAQGARGGGVLVISERSNGRFLRLDRQALRCRDIQDHLSQVICGVFSLNQRRDEGILERRVQVDPLLGRVSYKGIPDIRVIVFRGVPVMAMVRFPTQASKGRANLHLGGVGAGIDLATGLTFHAVVKQKPIRLHPDLGLSLVGIPVPYWDEILHLAARCYESVPLGYMGVDIAIDAIDGPCVLELNARSGLNIQLANRRGLWPLLAAVVRVAVEKLTITERVQLGKEIFSEAS
jgi:alpha-L-glutamate ligase-like protein